MYDMCVTYFHVVEMFALLLRAFTFLNIVSNTLVFNLMRVECISRRKKTQPKLLPCLKVRPNQRGRIIYERRRALTQRSETSSGTSRLIFAIGCVNEEHSKNPVNLENNKKRSRPRKSRKKSPGMMDILSDSSESESD